MRHLDLFSGIGGFALAASWVWGEEHEIVSFCEIESFPQKVLKKHWPEVPIHDDIKTMKGDKYGRIDILTGGFPCQPYSVAGKQRGSEDDRALWPEMFRIIKEAKPNWIIGENVAGFINMGLDDCIFDMESEGYETTAFIIPACGVGAQHKRERVWIIANHAGPVIGENNKEQAKRQEQELGKSPCRNNIPDADCSGRKTGGPRFTQEREKKRSLSRDNCKCFKWNGWPLTESPVCGANDGISSRVDRIKGLGNAIVPHTVVPIMQAIKQIEADK